MTIIDSTRHRLSTLLGLCVSLLSIHLFLLSSCIMSFQTATSGNDQSCQPKWKSSYLQPEPEFTGTFSIVAVDPKIGVCGAAVASKYPSVGKVVPYVRAGVGAFCTQYGHNPDWGELALDLLAKGYLPEQVLAELLHNDALRDIRQLAIIDMSGRAANRNAAKADPTGNTWWGAVSGKYYACQGNILVGREVIFAMARAYEETEGSLADRLMVALIAGDCAGGDHRGRLAAGMRVAKEGIDGYWLELYVDNSDDAVIDLARKYAALDHEAKGAWRGGKLPFELLIAKGAKGAEISNIYLAVYLGDISKVRDFIEKGTDVNAKNTVGDTPLHYAAKSGSAGKDIIELLIAKGIDVNAKNNKGQTPVDIAASRNRSEVVKLLIEKGADVSLHVAARFGALAKVKSLIEKGTDIDTKDEMDWTALYWAASMGQEDVAEFLIAKGADVHVKAKDISTALHQAARAGGMKLVKLLILKGADVNTKDKYGNTPLHSAASAGHRAVVELLIAKGANVDAKGRNDWTPLHNAARQGHKGVVELLVAQGADINAKDKQGRTPLSLAKQRDHTEVVELLRKN